MNDSKLLPITWFWNSNIHKFIPESVLDCLDKEIQEKIGKNQFEKGLIGDDSLSRKDLEYRDTEVFMFDSIHWFSGILFNIGLASNIQAEWNFGVHSPQCLQIGIYRESQHYQWHSDWAPLMRDPNIRKISVVCMLSDKQDYTGGALEVEGVGEVEMNRGDIVVFPSLVPHKVHPVSSGTRKTATLWIIGNRSF